MAQKTILIVEDESLVAFSLRLELQKSGYTVCDVAMLAEAAVKQAEQSRPDVVLMDISLHSDMDGIEAAKEIHSRFGIPIIYMTGYVNPEVKERAMAAGPIGYFVKPVDCRAVQKTIEAALSES